MEKRKHRRKSWQILNYWKKPLPVAPLKLAALESCKELAQKVNDYIVSFRENTINEVTESPLYELPHK